MLQKSLSRDERLVIFLSSLGGALEFYDFVIYLFFAKILSELFFPNTNQIIALMEVFVVFAIGYLARPLGGIVFSHFGDKYGRKRIFMTTLLCMALPTFLIGLLPTAKTWGVSAAIILSLLRLLQGFSVGGEIPGAITFAGEHVSSDHRGLACGWIFFGVNCGLSLGAGINLLLSLSLTSTQITQWGWRIPFILGGILGIISYFLRKRLSETPSFVIFQKKMRLKTIPLIETFRHHGKQVLRGMMITSLGAAIICALFLYMPVYLISILNYPGKLINILNAVNSLVFSVWIVLFSWLSDLYGRKLLLLLGSALFILFSYFLYGIFLYHNVVYLIISMQLLIIVSAMVVGTYPVVLTELFPTSVRYSGVAIAYNIAFAAVGGLGPIIITYLISYNKLGPSFYLSGCAMLCFLASVGIRDKFRQSLDSSD